MELIEQLKSLSNSNLISDKIIIKLVLSLTVILIFWLIYQIILMIIKKQIKKEENFFTTRKVAKYIIIFSAIIVIAQFWFKGVQSIGTFLGLFTAGLAIALKDILTNFAGWIYLLSQTPFKIGDRIQINDHQGDVIDIGAFKFTLLEIGNWVDANQSTGRMIRIPNADVFNQAIANYSKGFNYNWFEIPVIVTYESDWKKAKKLLTKLINDYCSQYEEKLKKELKLAKREFPINYTYITPIIYTSSLDHGISLTIRYLVATRRIRESTHEIWESILELVDEHDDIDLAYPTYRYLT